MTREDLVTFLEEFRPMINEDGGDYIILKAEENYARLKIKGARNKDRSRNNLFAVISLALKKKFPDHPVILEMEAWIPAKKNTPLEKLKDFFLGE